MHTNTNTLVKRFVAPSMRRALDMVREELGPEAVILSSQKVPQGVEVITSLEPDLPTRGIDVRREFGQHFDTEHDTAMSSDSAWQIQAGVDQAAAQYPGRVEMNEHNTGAPKRGEQLALEIERARERMLDAKRRAKDAETSLHGFDGAAQRQNNDQKPAIRPKNNESAEARYTPASAELTQKSPEGRLPTSAAGEQRLEGLQNELADMRMILEQQLWRMSERDNVREMPSQVKLPAGFSVLNEHLSRLGLPNASAQRLLSELGQGQKVSQSWRSCMTRLAKDIPVVKQDFIANGGIFAFVGQTGVGKTTTIAKLAARFVLEHGPGKVALVTTDTYRVGAYDQLRSLGRILSVPVRAVDADNSLVTVLSGLRQFPLILIDTAGFRHGDPLLRDQLRKLDSCPAIKRVLVMACNSQLQTMKASTHAYTSATGIDACVLSKLDEAATLGEVISVVVDRELPVAYTTDGQEIPKDICCASGHQLVAAAVALIKNTAADTSDVQRSV